MTFVFNNGKNKLFQFYFSTLSTRYNHQHKSFFKKKKK